MLERDLYLSLFQWFHWKWQVFSAFLVEFYVGKISKSPQIRDLLFSLPSSLVAQPSSSNTRKYGFFVLAQFIVTYTLGNPPQLVLFQRRKTNESLLSCSFGERFRQSGKYNLGICLQIYFRSWYNLAALDLPPHIILLYFP